MLIIRSEQVLVFEVAAAKAFERELLQHFEAFSPRLYEIRGQDVFLRLIRQGLDRARGYGLTNRGPLRFYIELMLCFGVDFDEDPQYPWAAAALSTGPAHDQTVRADQLYRDMLTYLRHVAGPENQYALEAAHMVRAANFESRLQTDGNIEAEILVGLERMYPRKCEYVGAKGLRALVREAAERARRNGLQSPRATGLLSGLMFAFGHGVLGDPLYPWVASTLLDPHKPEEDRIRRCYSKAMTYLDKLHENLGA